MTSPLPRGCSKSQTACRATGFNRLARRGSRLVPEKDFSLLKEGRFLLTFPLFGGISITPLRRLPSGCHRCRLRADVILGERPNFADWTLCSCSADQWWSRCAPCTPQAVSRGSQRPQREDSADCASAESGERSVNGCSVVRNVVRCYRDTLPCRYDMISSS